MTLVATPPPDENRTFSDVLESLGHGDAPKLSLKEMVEADYTSARKDSLVKLAGFQAFDHHE